jgi:hypothetical protein
MLGRTGSLQCEASASRSPTDFVSPQVEQCERLSVARLLSMMMMMMARIFCFNYPRRATPPE